MHYRAMSKERKKKQGLYVFVSMYCSRAGEEREKLYAGEKEFMGGVWLFE